MLTDKHSKHEYAWHKKGQVLLFVTILFTTISVSIIFSTISPAVRDFQMARDLHSSKKSYFAAEGGSEDAFYRIKNNLTISPPPFFSLDGAGVNINVVPLSAREYNLTSQASFDNNFRTVFNNIATTTSGTWSVRTWKEI